MAHHPRRGFSHLVTPRRLARATFTLALISILGIIVTFALIAGNETSALAGPVPEPPEPVFAPPPPPPPPGPVPAPAPAPAPPAPAAPSGGGGPELPPAGGGGGTPFAQPSSVAQPPPPPPPAAEEARVAALTATARAIAVSGSGVSVSGVGVGVSVGVSALPRTGDPGSSGPSLTGPLIFGLVSLVGSVGLFTLVARRRGKETRS